MVDSSLEFLILASDGLWDVVTNEVGTNSKSQNTNPRNNDLER